MADYISCWTSYRSSVSCIGPRPVTGPIRNNLINNIIVNNNTRENLISIPCITLYLHFLFIELDFHFSMKNIRNARDLDHAYGQRERGQNRPVTLFVNLR